MSIAKRKGKYLFVIDIQYAFINKYTEPTVNKIIEFIKRNKCIYDKIVITRYVNDESSACYKILNWKDCMREDSNSSIVKGINSLGDILLEKSTYSCFTGVNKEILRNIEEAHFVGFNTDACVLASVIECFDLGVKPVIISDLVASTEGDEYTSYILRGIKKAIGEDNIKSSVEVGK